jgi:hypothetical protein
VAVLGWALAIFWHGKRRPIAGVLSWGEAMASAAFAFALMFWAYGVVPHQWLQYANNELGWTPSKSLWTAGEIKVLGMPLPPFEVNFEKISHLVVVLIYGFFLALHVAAWALWQDRTKRSTARKARELQPSSYGRPLVKQG